MLFRVGCAAILAAVNPVFADLPEIWRGFSTGLAAALGALLLTVVFVRWEKVSLKDVGVVLESGSFGRLLPGFIAGLLIVGIWASALIHIGSLKMVPDANGLPAQLAITVGVYLVLLCREELAFHGYPLRRWNQVFGLWPAQILVALIFALEHRLGGAPWEQALLTHMMH